MKLALDMVGIDKIPADSAIYQSGSGIKKVLMGIDMGVAELALARELGYDAVIAHHPKGAFSTFYDIIDVHAEQMIEAGLPEDVAWEAIKDLKEKYVLQSHTVNTDHAPSFARLINMPYMNIHYPLDQLGRIRMMRALALNMPENGTIDDLIKALQTIPEFKEASTNIEVRLGDRDCLAGNYVVAHGAGTNGGYNVAKAYYDHGIDTVIYIHVHQGDLKKIRSYENSGNLVVTGHIVSDLIGINPFIEKLEDEGLIVDRVSGL